MLKYQGLKMELYQLIGYINMEYKVIKRIKHNNTLVGEPGDIIDVYRSEKDKYIAAYNFSRNTRVIFIDSNSLDKFIKEFLIPNTLDKDDKVNHPSHYTWLKEKCGIEVIDITRWLDFNTGNAVKYLLRAGHKSEEGMTDKEKTIQDLQKAVWYIEDKIKTLEDGNNV